MFVVFDAYVSTWKHSLNVSYFIPLLILFHELANKLELLLIALSKGSNSLSLSHFYTRSDVVSEIDGSRVAGL